MVDKDLYESDRFVDLVATEGLPPGCGSPTDPAAPRRLYLLVKDGADRGVGFARHIAKTFAHGIQDVPESSMKRVVMLDDDVILEVYKPSEWDRLRQAALPIGRQGPLNQTPGGAAAAAAAASRPEQTKLTMAQGINLLDDVMDHTQVKPKNTKPAMVVARCEYQVAKVPMTEWVLSFTQAGGGGCMLLDLERCRNASFICRRVRTELSPQAWKNLKDIRATRYTEPPAVIFFPLSFFFDAQVYPSVHACNTLARVRIEPPPPRPLLTSIQVFTPAIRIEPSPPRPQKDSMNGLFFFISFLFFSLYLFVVDFQFGSLMTSSSACVGAGIRQRCLIVLIECSR